MEKNRHLSAIVIAIAAIVYATNTTAAGVAIGLPMEAPQRVDRNVPFQMIVSVTDSNGAVVPDYRGTIRLQGSGIIAPPDYTYTAEDNGVHAFAITASGGGWQFVSAFDVNTPTIRGSETFLVVCPDLIVTASNNGPVCSGQRAILTATSNQQDVTFYWQGFRAWDAEGPIALAPGPALYHVYVTNSVGCLGGASTIVEPARTPPVNLSVPSTRLCGRGPMTAKVTNSTAFTAFDWSVSGGSILSGQGTASIEAEPNFQGNMIIVANATDALSGCRTSNSAYIDTAPVPTAAISAPGSICTDEPQTASVPLDRYVSYAWLIFNGTIVSGHGTNSVRFLRANEGDVTLKATVLNSQCTVSETMVIPASGPKALLDAHVVTCSGEETVIPIALIGAPPFSITWSDGLTQDGILTTSAMRPVSPLESTAYAISAVSDANCVGAAEGTARVTVESAPEIQAHPKSTAVARGQRATLSVIATGTNLRFYWYEGVTGNRSRNIGASREFTTPPLQATTSYWVEVVGGCGTAHSKTAEVAVSTRRRAARH